MELTPLGTPRAFARSVAYATLFVACGVFADARDSGDYRDTPINSATELRDWCKAESQASLVGKGISPTNWTASYWTEGPTFVVKGQWRVDAAEVNVECRIPRGAQTRYASISFSGKD